MGNPPAQVGSSKIATGHLLPTSTSNQINQEASTAVKGSSTTRTITTITPIIDKYCNEI